MNILWFVPILSIMMFVHELGHFVTARLSGITVLEFGFGLPPRIWGFKRNGVVYSINWIPFGAFGIVLSGGLIRLNPLAAVSQGFTQTVRAIVGTLSVP